MTKLEEDFTRIKSKFPFLGDIIIFVRAIRFKNYSVSIVKKHFKKLCEDEGWCKTERKQLLEWLLKANSEKRVKKTLIL